MGHRAYQARTCISVQKRIASKANVSIWFRGYVLHDNSSNLTLFDSTQPLSTRWGPGTCVINHNSLTITPWPPSLELHICDKNHMPCTCTVWHHFALCIQVQNNPVWPYLTFCFLSDPTHPVPTTSGDREIISLAHNSNYVVVSRAHTGHNSCDLLDGHRVTLAFCSFDVMNNEKLCSFSSPVSWGHWVTLTK